MLHTEHSDVILNNFSLMGACEKDRERSQSIVEDDESVYKEDYTLEMSEGERRLKHFPQNTSKHDLTKKTSTNKLKSYENFNNLPAFSRKPSYLNISGHGKKIEKEPQEITNKREIVWDFSVEGWQIKPIVDVEIGSNDFSQSCMQFFLWAPKEIEDNEKKFDAANLRKVEGLNDLIEDSESEKSVNLNLHVIKNKLIGECYININKLFKDDIRAVFILFIDWELFSSYYFSLIRIKIWILIFFSYEK